MNWTWQDTFDVMSVIWLTDYCCMALYLTIQYVTNIITKCRWRSTRLNTHLQLLNYNPVQNSWDANAITIVEIMHFPYFSHDAVSTSWLRVFFMTINIAWGRGGRRGNRLLQPVHSQAFILGKVDYELALSVSSCDHSLKRHFYWLQTPFFVPKIWNFIESLKPDNEKRCTLRCRRK